jgi:hypothetical protein
MTKARRKSAGENQLQLLPDAQSQWTDAQQASGNRDGGTNKQSIGPNYQAGHVSHLKYLEPG